MKPRVRIAKRLAGDAEERLARGCIGIAAAA
jgi:hypothetical protein